MLSGGERRRLQLLLTLLERPNVLLLDEPTNDLDLDTLRALEDFLDDWPGAAVIVSHDRALLDRTCDDVIVFESGRRPARYPGGVEAWVSARQRNRRAGTARAPASRKQVMSGALGRRAKGQNRASNEPSSASTLRHRLRAIDREMQPLLTQRSDLETRMGDGDHRERQAAASAFADVVQATTRARRTVARGGERPRSIE